jgi:transposase
LAAEVLDRIGKLYQIEHHIHGRSPEERLAAKEAQAVPILSALHVWMIEKASQVDPKSPLMEAFNYSLNRWESLCHYARDERLSIDNNSAERSVRGVGIGRKNYMFFGSDSGGDRAAILYSLIETCKLNGIDPQRYLHYVLERIADHPINRVHELLPWNVADKLNQPFKVAEAMAA